jgi:hypothetical protein
LITHQAPDFDAYCSLYLARKILEGEITPVPIPERWDWFNPAQTLGPSSQRWPMLLAAYASAVDHGKPLRCQAEKRIHAVLYAALRRGRELGPGAVSFFDAVREVIEHRGLNPLFDSLFDQRSEFGPELDFLERDRTAYERDLKRGRHANVTVLRSPRPFGEWFQELEKTPLLENPDLHLSPPGHKRERVEGIFIRDPESVLFKEWAREDAEHAANGVGFLFTAVCYSGALADAGSGNNTARYFFALDPERAAGHHLYHLWAALQTAEFREQGAASPPEGVPRPDFRGRKVGPDPWYDGNAYDATIIDTPRQGTRLKSDGGSDLRSHQPNTVEAVLASSLERFWVESLERPLMVKDLACSEAAKPVYSSEAQLELKELADIQPGDDCLRFASLELDEAINPLDPLDASNIGRTLWPVLEERGIKTVPADFESRHLVRVPAGLVIWNRRGVAVAWRRGDPPNGPDGLAVCKILRNQLDNLASLTCDVEKYVNAVSSSETGHTAGTAPTNPTGYEAVDRSEVVDQHGIDDRRGQRLDEGRVLVVQVARLRIEAARPEGRVLRGLIETSRFSDIAASLHNLHQQTILTASALEAERNVTAIRETQDKIEWVEIFLVGVYSIYLINYLGEGFHFGKIGDYVGWCILWGTAIAWGLGWLLLRPHLTKTDWRKAFGVLVLVGILLTSYIYFGMSKRHQIHNEERSGAKESKTAAYPERD